MDEMQGVIAGAGALDGAGQAAGDAALARIAKPEPFDVEAGRARLDVALQGGAA